MVGQSHAVVHGSAQWHQLSARKSAENGLLSIVGHAHFEHGRKLVGVVTPDAWLGCFKVVLRRIVGIDVGLYARESLFAVA